MVQVAFGFEFLDVFARCFTSQVADVDDLFSVGFSALLAEGKPDFVLPHGLPADQARVGGVHANFGGQIINIIMMWRTVAVIIATMVVQSIKFDYRLNQHEFICFNENVGIPLATQNSRRDIN